MLLFQSSGLQWGGGATHDDSRSRPVANRGQSLADMCCTLFYSPCVRLWLEVFETAEHEVVYVELLEVLLFRLAHEDVTGGGVNYEVFGTRNGF